MGKNKPLRQPRRWPVAVLNSMLLSHPRWPVASRLRRQRRKHWALTRLKLSKTLLSWTLDSGKANLSTRWINTTGVGCKNGRSEEHTSELQSRFDLVCRLLLEKKK